MDTIFTWAAAIGGALFLCQFAFALLGHHGDGDAPDMSLGEGLDPGCDLHSAGHLDAVDVAVETDAVAVDFHDDAAGHSMASDVWFVGMFSLRAIFAGAMIFGLSGLGLTRHLPVGQRILAASGCALATMYAIGWLIRTMHRLEHDGTVHLIDTLGTTGTVYLRIPAAKSGVGKVTVNVKGRTMEYEATTPHHDLASGTEIVVTGVLPPATVEVTAVTTDDQ